MGIISCKYCGPALDMSGYGEANRNDIGALVSAGIDVTTQVLTFELEKCDTGKLGYLAAELDSKPLDYDIKIIHVTPNLYPNLIEDGKYHIGRVIWETDKLPADFAKAVRLLDEIWTASEYNKKAIEKAGVKVPIYVISEAIDASIDIEEIEPFPLAIAENFTFYAISEWTKRKNFEALLESYWREFEEVDEVSLIVKTYITDFLLQRRSTIDRRVSELKELLQFKHYAPTYFNKILMDRDQIYRFHKTFDCYVSTSRGEGWGVGIMEAMLIGKPVISTVCGGINEYLTDGEHALLLPCRMIPVKANPPHTQWYTLSQNWADVDAGTVQCAMRWVFDNPELAKEMGARGREFVKANFDLKVVGEKMRKRLLEIGRAI